MVKVTTNDWQEADYVALAGSLWRSYHELTNVPDDIDALTVADTIYHHPCPVLCHDGASDPRFIYVNLAAQTLFERPWPEFIGIPSRLSAEPEARDDRAQMLARATEQGYIDDYQGVRISRSGRRFRISKTVIWTVRGNADTAIGQAALIRQWSFLDS